MPVSNVSIYCRGQVIYPLTHLSKRFLRPYLRVHERGEFSIGLVNPPVGLVGPPVHRLKTLGRHLCQPRDGVNQPLDDPDQSREAVLQLADPGRELRLPFQ